MTNKTVVSHVAAGPESSDSITPDRRTVVKSVATAGLAVGVALPTYLRGFETSAYAQTSAPVKMGFIEDESGNLSVYGIQKLHAAQPSRRRDQRRQDLKGSPDIGAGFLGAEATAAKNPPVISKDGTSLAVVDDGSAKSPVDLAYVEDADILVDSGEKGILGRELQLLSSDGQSNNAVWQQLARKLIQEDKVDVLVAGLRERRAGGYPADRRPVQAALFLLTNQYEGGRYTPPPIPSALGRCASRRGHSDRAVHGREIRAQVLHDRRRL